jgi:hypothetical protein
MKRITQHPLFPLPKVYVPMVAGWIAFATQVIAVGSVSRVALAQLVASTGYAIIGWATPQG